MFETVKSCGSNQPEVSIQNVLLSPSDWRVRATAEMAYESNLLSLLSDVKGVSKKTGNAEGAEL